MTHDVEDTVELRTTLPPLSEATRASLLAVRRAQEAARERARRETVRARMGVGVLVSAIAAAVIVLGPPVKRRLVAARAAAAATTPSRPVAPLTKGAIPASSRVAAAPLPAPARPAEAAPAPVVPAKAMPTPAAHAEPGRTLAANAAASTPAESACAETLEQHRWQISIEECTHLFESHPGDAPLALRIAHAHHAKGHLADAGEWAQKAIALDPNLAEGFVLVARAEKLAGRADGALQAYRHYLSLAPRGWHAAEARAALRAAPAEPSHARGDGRADTSSSFAARQ